MGGGLAGYATGVWRHVGDRFTQVGDEDLSGTQGLVTVYQPAGTIGISTRTTF